MSNYPTIELGYGLIEVAEGTAFGKHALMFGSNGSGVLGEPLESNREATEEELLAVVTFANQESVDILIETLHKLRAGMQEWLVCKD